MPKWRPPSKPRSAKPPKLGLAHRRLGLVGTRKRLDYTAIGDSVNTAKRLQENAAPDQILVSAAAEARVHGLAEVRAVPAIQAHGKKQPLEVYELLGLTAG